MSRLRIIVLDRVDDPGARTRFNCLFWADVPAGRERFYADAEKKSRWVDALAGDNAALAAGQMVEERVDFVGAPGTTMAQMRADLQQRWTDFQASVTAANPLFNRYGATWDGTTWTPGGIS